LTCIPAVLYLIVLVLGTFVPLEVMPRIYRTHIRIVAGIGGALSPIPTIVGMVAMMFAKSHVSRREYVILCWLLAVSLGIGLSFWLKLNILTRP
jgi:hypothetical protein